MSLVDPIGIAAHSPNPALTMSRVSLGNFKSTFLDLTNGFNFHVEHSDPADLGKKQERHYARMTQTKTVTAPNGSTVPSSISLSLAMSVPPYGWTTADKLAICLALLDTMADTDVTYARWVGFEG